MVLRRQCLHFGCALWLVVLIQGQDANTQETFLCHHDLCTRDVHFCGEDVKRCVLCSENQIDCNTTNMPRDCFGFCRDIQIKALRHQIDTEKQKNAGLSGEIQKLNIEQEELRAEVKNATNLIHSLNETTQSEDAEIRQTKDGLRECEQRETLMIALGSASIGTLIISILVVVLCVCCRRRGNTCGYSPKQQSNDKESLVSKDSALDLDSLSSNQDESLSTETVGTEPSCQDARLSNVAPTSPEASFQSVYK